MRTLIDIMIDRACGISDAQAAPSWIALRCPQCARTQRAPGDATDPPGTATVQMCYPACLVGDSCEIVYFDAAGRELFSI